MSLTSSTHIFVPFDSKKLEAFTGQRLSKIGYKQTAEMTAKGEKARQSICVSLPPLRAEDIKQDHYILLMPHILNMLEDAQDGVVRKLYEAGKTDVRDDQLTIQALANYLNEANAGRRMTKESIIAWTESSGLADALRLRFAELLGVSDVPTPEDEARVEMQVKSYKEKFAGLAGTKTYYDLPVAQNLLKALSVGEITEDDAFGAVFTARLQEMVQNPKSADMLGL